jgi:3-oxoacyl-[acyl-carrier-protein] synthase-3
LAAESLLEKVSVDRSRIGVIVSTSVSRDYVEPSNACFVHKSLGLSSSCLNFDIGNACLAFVTAIDMIGNMIERRQIDYGLIVDGEDSRQVVESTVERLSRPTAQANEFRDQFATLTLGSGGAAMLLSHSRHEPEGHRYTGSVTLSATEHNQLCYGHADGGFTDTAGLMKNGVSLAEKTWALAVRQSGWSAESVDLFAMHQVSQVHTQRMAESVGFGLEK